MHRVGTKPMLPLLRDLPTNHGSPGMRKPMISMLSPLEKLSSSHAAPLWSSVAVHLPFTGKQRQTAAFQCEAHCKCFLARKDFGKETVISAGEASLSLRPLSFIALSDSDPYCAPQIILLSTCSFKGLFSTQESLKMQPLATECHCQNRRWTRCIFGQEPCPCWEGQPPYRGITHRSAERLPH